MQLSYYVCDYIVIREYVGYDYVSMFASYEYLLSVCIYV